MIEGLSHITLVVKDIDRTSEIITHVLGGKQTYDSGEKTFSISKERFFDVNGVWIALMEGDPLPSKTYNHIAFKTNDRALSQYIEKIKALGLEMKEPRSRQAAEGRSLYFYDYDNHLFELHTGTLDERLKLYSS